MTMEQPTHAEAFDVRPVTADDGDALADLFENSPDTGDLGVAPQFKIDPYVAYTEMFPTTDTHGLDAVDDDGSLIGAGFVALTQARIDGVIRPTAYLAGLAVREDYRGRGIAKRLAAERIDYARQHHDEDCVVYAQIQTGNDPSEAVAKTWADDFPYQSASVLLQPLGENPEDDEYTVRPATDSEYETIVKRANEFYADAELFSPHEVESFRECLEHSPIDEPVRQYPVAVQDGEIVAGAQVIEAHKLMWGKLEDLPPELEEAEELPPEIPESREFRHTAIVDVWYAPSHESAGKAVIDAVRSGPNVGNQIIVQLDPDGPVGRIVETGGQMFETRVAIQGLDSPKDDTFIAPSVE